MYSSSSTDYQKFTASPPPTAPPPPAPYGSQPVMGTPIGFSAPAQVPSQWSTGLCDCASDCSNCCITCWCPCITFGQIAEIVDKGSTCKSNEFIDKLHVYVMMARKCGYTKPWSSDGIGGSSGPRRNEPLLMTWETSWFLFRQRLC
ncbi:hypothetical protein RJ640_001683 [Escallonia rubra]|uniref:Uncharacterized protein n=1 Tax=Escallonia rubra TaxID=112253 RepID=A0AA88RSH7_9ASTE|nr:hypothetical protein RJ640_001683 [Escallonia rubra]